MFAISYELTGRESPNRATRGMDRMIHNGGLVSCRLAGGPFRAEMNRLETIDIDETAAVVDEAGGHGITIQLDHLVPDEVHAL